MSINAATLRVERELHALTSTILDAQTRSLVEAWVQAWDQVSAEVEAAALELTTAARGGRVTRTMVLRSRRAQAALEATAESLARVAARTGDIISADLQQAVLAAATAEVDMVASQLTGTRRAQLVASLVYASPRQITAMVARATQQITALSWPLGVEATVAVRRELLRGVAVGDNPRTVARRMVRGIEDRFDGGLQRALVISRTEMLDAMRAAALEIDRANAKVLTGWTWVAHLDAATCRSCIANHGRDFPLDTPGPLDHQQGRCARVPKTKTWAELGFPGIQDAADATPDADAWFAGLSVDQQKSILTADGYAAWKAGEWPRSEWSTTRSTPGWRDSKVPARPPKVDAA